MNEIESVIARREQLEATGEFERALVDAYMRTDGGVDPDWIGEQFATCDRSRLRAISDGLFELPFPLGVFRGVSGPEGRRRERGWSWTHSLTVACYFSTFRGQDNPAIYVAEIQRVSDILCVVSGATEREIIWRPEVGAVHRLGIDRQEIERYADAYVAMTAKLFSEDDSTTTKGAE